jgi:hypothetical protein
MTEKPDLLPRDMKFDRECIDWCSKYINDLCTGHWPASRPSGYLDVNVYVQRGILHATFETAVLVAAEVKIRVKKCGLDGYLWEDRFVRGMDEREIAKQRHLREEDVSRRINKVLWYAASGRNQRDESYEDWKNKNRFKRNIRGTTAGVKNHPDH